MAARSCGSSSSCRPPAERQRLTYRSAMHARTRNAERGQGLVEYGLILSGIAIVAIVTLVFFGDALAHVLDVIGNAIDQATA